MRYLIVLSVVAPLVSCGPAVAATFAVHEQSSRLIGGGFNPSLGSVEEEIFHTGNGVDPLDQQEVFEFGDPGAAFGEAPGYIRVESEVETEISPRELAIRVLVDTHAVWDGSTFDGGDDRNTSVDGNAIGEIHFELDRPAKVRLRTPTFGDTFGRLTHESLGFSVFSGYLYDGDGDCGSLGSEECNAVSQIAFGGGVIPAGRYSLYMSAFAFDDTPDPGPCEVWCERTRGRMTLTILPALAVEGRRLRVIDPDRPTRRSLHVTLVGEAIALPSAGAPDDPSARGAALHIYNPATAEVESIALPASNWSARRTSFVYRDRAAEVGPCRFVVIKAGRIRASCKGAPSVFSLDETGQGSMDASLELGRRTSYCGRFGGNVQADEPGRFIARNAPPDADCLVP